MKATLKSGDRAPHTEESEVGVIELEERLLSFFENQRRQSRYIQWLFIKASRKFLLLDVEGIMWLEAQGNYVKVHHRSGAYLLRATINALEDQLNPRKFLRIRRSVIVQIEQIAELRSYFHGDYLVTLRNGTQLMLNRNYRSKFREAVGVSL
ncbi:MAG TPA: LytTR family DNA-binding domain-containing protein [Pyrinomonadaceae bacterium]